MARGTQGVRFDPFIDLLCNIVLSSIDQIKKSLHVNDMYVYTHISQYELANK